LAFLGVSSALTLKESLVQALKTSEEVTVSHEGVKRARLDPYRALTTVLPKVDYNLDYLHSRVGAARSDAELGQTLGEIGGASNHSSQGEILLTERLIDFSLPVLLARARHTIKGSLADLFYVSQEYLFQVVSGYYNVLKSQRMVEINEEFLKQTKEHLDVARVRLEVGEVIKTDVLRAEVDYATAQRNLIQASNDLDLALESLARYLHLPKERIQPVRPLTVLKPQLPLDKILQMTYLTRPDLKSYEEAVYSARNDKQLVFTRFLPYMDMQANWATFGSTPYPHERDNWSVYGVVTVPILEGGAEVCRPARYDRLAHPGYPALPGVEARHRLCGERGIPEHRHPRKDARGLNGRGRGLQLEPRADQRAVQGGPSRRDRRYRRSGRLSKRPDQSGERHVRSRGCRL